MTVVLTPGDEQELATIITDVPGRKTPLAVVGGGTRSAFGRPMQTAATLSTAGMTGVTLYEPAELVLSARAGTPVAEVETLLAENRQRLAFEPPDHRAIFATTGEPTIGSVAAANLSGPRRIQAGAARDSLIGVRAVNGRGDPMKSGGRVMKNVAGYDLVKFLAGSYGTLAVLSEVTFKVLPVPESEATLAWSGLSDQRAVAAMAAALGSPFAVTGAAHIPATDSDPSRTFVRIEGFAASVEDRATRLRELLREFGQADVQDTDISVTLWRTIRDLDALTAPLDACIWRLSLAPSAGPPTVDTLRPMFPFRALYDWAGGLVWIAGGEGPDAGARAIRDVLRPVGGHATLIRAPADVRLAVDVFEPLSPPLMDLTRKLKASFDPDGILNPGRMYAGV